MGSEIFCKRLAAALRTKQEFSNEEVAAFSVLLRMDSFIKVDEQYFEQVGSAGLGSVECGQAAGSVSKATGSLPTETDSRPPPKQRVGTSRRGRQAKRRMAGEKEYGSLSSFGFSKASSLKTKQPPARSLLTDVHEAMEPAAAETAVVEPVATSASAVEPVAVAAVPPSGLPAVTAIRPPLVLITAEEACHASALAGPKAVEPALHASAHHGAPTLFPTGEPLPKAVEPATTEPSSASPAVEAARETAAREAAVRGDLAFLAFVADPKAAVAAATSLAWGENGGASEMEVAVAQEHLERQNTEAATLERRKIVKSERLKSLEKKAAAALEKLEAATAEAREAAAREAAARGDLAFLAFVADPKTAAATSPVGNSVSDPEIRDIKMRPGMRWLIESMNRTVSMFDADKNDEDGMSVDWPEQHPDRHKAVDERVVPNLVCRFDTVEERVTRARASLPRGSP